MFRVIPELLTTLTSLLPPWLVPPVIALLLLALSPAWLHWVRTKQIKRALHRGLRSPEGAHRQRHLERAFKLAGQRPRRLIALADEAVHLGYKPVWTRALAKLDETGRYREDLTRIREKIEAVPKRSRHPIEEAVIIERMWSEGLHDAARQRLEECRSRFPDDPDLAALADHLEALS